MTRGITVLLSAFNGEAYIGEQLDSILSQTLRPHAVLVRDDGSADRTPEILARYADEGKIRLLYGRNVGFKESFRLLLTACPEEDDFAFSDQDDLWLPDKLERARKALDAADGTAPCLYHGAYRISDEQLRPTGAMLPPRPPFTFRRCLTENVLSGFAMVGNAALRKAMLSADWSRIDFHDWLAGAIALGTGTLIMDDTITSVHRRLRASVTADSALKGLRWVAGALNKDTNMKARNAAFAEAFAGVLSPEDRRVLGLMNSSRVRDRLRKAFYPARWRYALPDEIAVRLAMLRGTL